MIEDTRTASDLCEGVLPDALEEIEQALWDIEREERLSRHFDAYPYTSATRRKRLS